MGNDLVCGKGMSLRLYMAINACLEMQQGTSVEDVAASRQAECRVTRVKALG